MDNRLTDDKIMATPDPRVAPAAPAPKTSETSRHRLPATSERASSRLPLEIVDDDHGGDPYNRTGHYVSLDLKGRD